MDFPEPVQPLSRAADTHEHPDPLTYYLRARKRMVEHKPEEDEPEPAAADPEPHSVDSRA